MAYLKERLECEACWPYRCTLEAERQVFTQWDHPVGIYCLRHAEAVVARLNAQQRSFEPKGKG